MKASDNLIKTSTLDTAFSSSLYHTAWSGGNFLATAVTTASAIALVQSPLQSVMYNLTREGRFIPSSLPASTIKGAFLGMVRWAYAGTGASLPTSIARTGYVSHVKNNKPVEIKPTEEMISATEEGLPPAKATGQLTYVAASAFSELAVTKLPFSLSDMRKTGVLPTTFKWKTPHNVYALIKGQFGMQLTSSALGFSAMLVGEEKIAKELAENNINSRFVSGAAAGTLAAVASYPLAAFITYAQLNATVDNGKLIHANSFKLLKELGGKIVANPRAMAVAALCLAVKQLPLRITGTSSIFAIVAGVNDTLGNNPLGKVVPEKYQPVASSLKAHGIFAQDTATADKKEALSVDPKFTP